MAITFAYTESTNIVVVTGGTSGTPATFADFVTTDQIGVDTLLLSAGSPANDLALTYAVRPVEDLALLNKCVVANKSAEADFIFITGKDWRGTAQTESIDVTVGNGSYTTTKYWSEITTLDCSDNANGGGTVWADGDLSVTQDIWGVIWDYGNGQYKIDSHYEIGNGSTATYFQSTKERVTFASGMKCETQANAILTIGDISGSYGINGSMWRVSGPYNGSSNLCDGGIVNIYASLISTEDECLQQFSVGITTIKNSILQANYHSDTSWLRRFSFLSTMTTINLVKVYFNNVHSLFLSKSPTIAEDVHVHRAMTGIEVQSTGVEISGVLLSTIYLRDVYIWTDNPDSDYTFKSIDSQSAISSTAIAAAADNDFFIEEAYTCNIHIADKDGANLSSVSVACKDTNANVAFTTQTTAADGTITEQIITYKKWIGPDETLTTYSPHKFTISKAGYKTLVLENIAIDGPIDWHLSLDNPIGAFAKPFVR